VIAVIHLPDGSDLSSPHTRSSAESMLAKSRNDGFVTFLADGEKPPAKANYIFVTATDLNVDLRPIRRPGE
jgi:hypothetical protein